MEYRAGARPILQRQTVRHIRCPGSPGHDVYDQAGNRKCDERDKPGVQQLSSNQGAASFAQNLPGVDALDAERNLRESKVDEIDDGDENEQDGNGGQRNGNRLVRTCDIGPDIALEMGFMQVNDTESPARHSPSEFRFPWPGMDLSALQKRGMTTHWNHQDDRHRD